MEKMCRAEQAADDNMAHAHYVLDNKGYKLTLRICNTYCLSTTNNVCTNAPHCYAVCTLAALLQYVHKEP